MIKVILFDADGVVVNKPEVFSKKLSKDYKIPYEDILPFFKKNFQPTLTGDADLKQALLPYLKKWGWKKSVDEFLLYWFKSEHYLDKALIKYVKQLRKIGIRCYIATDNEQYRTAYLKKEMKLENVFDGIYSSAILKARKIDTTFFYKLMLCIKQSNKDEVLFWDDDMENVNAAKSFGIKAEVYTNLADFKKKMKVYMGLQ
jgi:putative hydrolase of the HAD superfamily